MKCIVTRLLLPSRNGLGCLLITKKKKKKNGYFLLACTNEGTEFPKSRRDGAHSFTHLLTVVSKFALHALCIFFYFLYNVEVSLRSVALMEICVYSTIMH